MNKTMKITIAVSIAALGLFAFFARNSAAAGEKFVVALPMIEGFEDTKLVEVFKQINDVVSKKVGVPVLSENLPFKHNEDLFTIVKDRFKAKKADISYINGRDHGAVLLDKTQGFETLAVLGMNKSTIEKGCFFIRKGSFKSVADLRGKKWKGSATVTPRYVLYKNGINEPLESFFDVRGFETDSPVAPLIDDLKSGAIDVFSTYYHTMWLSGELKKKPQEIEALGCEPMESHWVFVARSDLPKERVDQFRRIFLSADKDPDFKQFGFAFMMIDGRFMPMDEKTASVNKSFAKLIRDNKWIDEEKAFMKKYFKQK